MGLQQSTAVNATTLTVDDCAYVAGTGCPDGCIDQMAYSLASGAVAFGMLLLQYHPGSSAVGNIKTRWFRWLMLGWNGFTALAIPVALFVWTWVNYFALNLIQGKASIPFSITTLCLAYMVINVSASWYTMRNGKDSVVNNVAGYDSTVGDVIAAFHYAIHIGLIAFASGWGYILNSELQGTPDFTTGHLALFRQLLLASGVMIIVTLLAQATMNFVREDVVSFKLSENLVGGRAEGLKGMMPILYMSKLQAYAIMFFWLAFAVVYYNDQFQVASFAIGVVIFAGALMTIAFQPHYFSTYIVHALFWWFIIAYFMGPLMAPASEVTAAEKALSCYFFPLLLPSTTADYSTCDTSFTLLCALSTAVSGMATVNVFLDKNGVDIYNKIYKGSVQVVDSSGVSTKLLPKVVAAGAS